jgi:hypothetical protein
MSLVVQIDSYGDGEKVLTLSPSLAILVTKESLPPADATELCERCGKCKEALRTWPLPLALSPDIGGRTFHYLACSCLVVVYGDHLERGDIIARWKEFRRIQNRALARTTHN